ncbi:hypothetical protein BZG36_03555 [Bifiguratus adelaidae]|uniref:Uncharacterized protein n=1 Tax=Bifiguratus adelaidae TaxID=1938954 RepID=A0A261Y098_9FUNG|nr:hypothetical protein BZG36_03555 [Bifiguratus adelaidae]
MSIQLPADPPPNYDALYSAGPSTQAVPLRTTATTLAPNDPLLPLFTTPPPSPSLRPGTIVRYACTGLSIFVLLLYIVLLVVFSIMGSEYEFHRHSGIRLDDDYYKRLVGELD